MIGDSGRIRMVTTTLALLLVLGRASLATDGDLASRGHRVYRERCAVCHGERGDGDGDAAYMLRTPPRDFRRGVYRFVSTWEGLATDDDLLGTITRGLPGSQMPGFAHLPEVDRRALVVALKSFSERPWAIAAGRPPASAGEPGVGPVAVPPPSPTVGTDRTRGETLFRDACATCHGDDGRGRARTDLVDDTGHPIRPRDFTTATFKGGDDPATLYRRIIIGIPGTPMPSNPWAYGDDAWELVAYVQRFAPRPR